MRIYFLHPYSFLFLAILHKLCSEQCMHHSFESMHQDVMQIKCAFCKFFWITLGGCEFTFLTLVQLWHSYRMMQVACGSGCTFSVAGGKLSKSGSSCSCTSLWVFEMHRNHLHHTGPAWHMHVVFRNLGNKDIQSLSTGVFTSLPNLKEL